MNDHEISQLIYSTDAQQHSTTMFDAYDCATRAGNQQLKSSQIFCGQSLLQRIAPRSGADISSRSPGRVCDMHSPGHRISCLIDGDGNIFSARYLVKGIQGGYEAAEALTQLVHRYFPSGPGQKKHTLQVWVFLNQQGLRKTLAECENMAAALNFDNFVRGFNQASRLFNIVDVGAVKEGADRKMTAFLELEVVNPETAYVIFGGSHDNGYASDLNHFKTCGYGEKLWLLEGYATMARTIQSLNLPTVPNQGLFERERLDDQHVPFIGDDLKRMTRTGRGRQRSLSEPGVAPPMSTISLSSSFANSEMGMSSLSLLRRIS